MRWRVCVCVRVVLMWSYVTTKDSVPRITLRCLAALTVLSYCTHLAVLFTPWPLLQFHDCIEVLHTLGSPLLTVATAAVSWLYWGTVHNWRSSSNRGCCSILTFSPPSPSTVSWHYYNFDCCTVLMISSCNLADLSVFFCHIGSLQMIMW